MDQAACGISKEADRPADDQNDSDNIQEHIGVIVVPKTPVIINKNAKLNSTCRITLAFNTVPQSW